MIDQFKHVTIIYNPKSGSPDSFFKWIQLKCGVRTFSESAHRSVENCISHIRNLLIKHNINVTIVSTLHSGHGTQLAQQYAPISDLIVAIGGDGTVNEIINGIIGSSCLLSIFPFGTTNILCSQLNLPRKLDSYISFLESSSSAQFIDLGCCNSRYFSCMAGVGYDALVIRHNHPKLKQLFGAFSYLMTSLFRFIFYKPPIISIIDIDHDHSYTGEFAVVSNTSFYGGRFHLANRAQLNDGLLDICLFKSFNLLSIFQFLMAIYQRKLSDHPGVFYFQSKNIHITSSTPTDIQLDGEFYNVLPAAITAESNRIAILTP